MRQIKVTDTDTGRSWNTTSAEFKKEYVDCNIADCISRNILAAKRYKLEYTGKVWHKGELCSQKVIDISNFIKKKHTITVYKSLKISYKEQIEEDLLDKGFCLENIFEFYRVYDVKDMQPKT